MNLLDQIKNDFSLYAEQAEKDHFFETRTQAFAELEKIGLPTTHHEEWKYTKLRKINEGNFSSSCMSNLDAKTLLDAGILNKIVCNKIVFVNGCLFPDLSVWLEDDSAIIISNLAQARKSHAAIFEKHFGKYAKIEGEGLNAMNTALMSDGAFVYIPESKQMKYPLMITNITDANGQNVLIQPRNLIVIEKNAHAYIIENYVAVGSNPSFTNVVNEIFVDENGRVLNFYKYSALSKDFSFLRCIWYGAILNQYPFICRTKEH
jgi:Fe-S cluster assembly protein SufD